MLPSESRTADGKPGRIKRKGRMETGESLMACTSAAAARGSERGAGSVEELRRLRQADALLPGDAGQILILRLAP